MTRKILWASRLDAQKNPQILGAIAAQLPDVQFLVYGRAVLGDHSMDWAKMPQNVIECGGFFSVDELPINEVDAFLYTSRFDGMPNILLEIAARGLPIITPPVGGVPDFLGSDWPLYVGNPDDVEGYVTALNRVLNEPDLRRSAVDTQFATLKSQRASKTFYNAVKYVLGTG